MDELVVCYGSENCVGNFTNISNITISTNGSNAIQTSTCLGNKCYNTLPLEKEIVLCFNDDKGTLECGKLKQVKQLTKRAWNIVIN